MNAAPSLFSSAEIPQVSVIIAAYNCSGYLASAIESALLQKDLILEVLVVDDASTDGTAAIAHDYEKTGRVRLLVNEVNRGPSFSRNRAIQAARGEWVAQLDGDDWFAPFRLVKLLQIAVATQADFVADDLFLVDDCTLKTISTRFLDNGVTWKKAHVLTPNDLVKYDLGSIKPLVRRSFLLEHALRYEENVKYGEDFLLILRAMLVGARIIVLPEPMYHLRRGNTGSLTTQRCQLFRQIEMTTRQLLANPEISIHTDVAGALKKRLVFIQRMSRLQEIAGLIKRKKIPSVFTKLLLDPILLITLLARLPTMISMRLRRHMHHKKLYPSFPPPVPSTEPASINVLR